MDRFANVYGRALGLNGEGEISDATGMRSIPGVGVIEESKN